MGEHVLGVDGVGGSSPPCLHQIRISYIVKNKKNKHSLDTKGNRKKDITELKKEGKEMKKKRICLVLAMMLILGMVGSTALAGNRPQSVFSGSFSTMLAGGETITYFGAGYERTLSSGLTVHGEAGLGSESIVTRFRGLLGIKEYLRPMAPQGLWIGGFASMDYWSITFPGSDFHSGFFFGFGVEAGYKYFFTPNLSVEPFVRAGHYTGSGDQGFALSLGASIGYAL